MRRWRWLIAALAAVALALGLWAWHSRPHPPPYPAAALDARLGVQVVPASKAQALVDELAGADRLNAVMPPAHADRVQELVGHLELPSPPRSNPPGSYGLVVIDERSDKVLPALYAVGPAGTNVGQGWDSQLGAAATKYAWLRPLAPVRAEDGWHDAGMAVTIPAATSGRVTFVGLDDPDALPIRDARSDLTFALVYFGDRDGQVFWAKRLRLS